MSRGLGKLQRAILAALATATSGPLNWTGRAFHGDHELTAKKLKARIYGESARLTSYQHTNLSRAIEGLEKRGLVTDRYERDLSCGYERVVGLTDAGKRMVSTIVASSIHLAPEDKGQMVTLPSTLPNPRGCTVDQSPSDCHERSEIGRSTPNAARGALATS